MEIVHKNTYFRAATYFWHAFCKNGNSIKWKFHQKFTKSNFLKKWKSCTKMHISGRKHLFGVFFVKMEIR